MANDFTECVLMPPTDHKCRDSQMLVFSMGELRKELSDLRHAIYQLNECTGTLQTPLTRIAMEALEEKAKDCEYHLERMARYAKGCLDT